MTKKSLDAFQTMQRFHQDWNLTIEEIVERTLCWMAVSFDLEYFNEFNYWCVMFYGKSIHVDPKYR